MDAKRRAKLKDAMRMLQSVAVVVEAVCDKEQDCIDNYPENLQGTDKYESMESAADSLSDALDKIEDVKECIEAAIHA